MKRKTRWLWLALAVCLLLTQLPAIAAETPPQMKIELRRVEGESAVEVSLLVPAGEPFRTAYAVLRYDPAMVKPTVEVPESAVDWETAVPAQSFAPETVSGKPSLVYETEGNGYLYFGAELLRRMQPGDTQLVTVRFTLTAEGLAAADGENTDTAELLKAWFSLAAPEVCQAVGCPVGFQAEVNLFAVETYHYVPEGMELGMFDKPMDAPTFETVTGPSLSGNGSAAQPSTDDFCSVVFYDWDGTLLGSRLVAKGGSLKGDSTETMDQRSNEDQTCAPLPPEGNEILDASGNGTGVINKAGYTFAGWVDYTTGHSTPMSALADAAGLTIAEEDLISLSNITENLIIKAAYNETGIGSSTGQKRYNVTFSDFVSGGGGLQTTFTVKRNATTRRGNDGVMYMEIILRPQGRGATYFNVPLGTSDLEEYTITMPSNAASLYQASNAISYKVYTLLEDGSTNDRSTSSNIRAADIVAH